jgi:multiple sugar transport system substrate-binding protein
MKKFVAFLCAVFLVGTILAGCKSGSASTSSTASNDDSQKVTLNMMWWGSQTRDDEYIAMIKLYMQQHPNVTVQYEYTGFSTYFDKLATMAAAKALPDVWQNSVADILSYAQKGQLVDLSPYIKNKTIDCSDWDKVSVNLGVIDGKNYGLTVGNAAYCMIYNPDILAKAGVKTPTLNWTWDDYIAAIKQIKDKTGIYGDSQFPTNIIEGYQMYLRQNGKAGLFNSARDALSYTNTDLWTKAFTLEKQMLDGGYITPLAESVDMQSIEQTGVATGKAAFLGVVSSNQAVAASTALGKDLALTTYPHATGEKQPGNFIGPTMYLGISKSSANQLAAAKLVNFILNDSDANKLCLMEKGVQASAKVRAAVNPLLTVTAQRVSEYVASISKIAPAFDNIYPTNYSQINDLYNKLVQDMMFGRTSIADAGKQFNTQVAALLKE